MDVTPELQVVVNPEVELWRDDGCICLKTLNPHGDPVELADDEAIALAHALLQLAGQPH